jgi:hypothetical protein
LKRSARRLFGRDAGNMEDGVATSAGTTDRPLFGDISRPPFDSVRPPRLIATRVPAQHTHDVPSAM